VDIVLAGYGLNLSDVEIYGDANEDPVDYLDDGEDVDHEDGDENEDVDDEDEDEAT
jgi:hypothetical protein